jgi:spore coat protein U-like protein
MSKMTIRNFWAPGSAALLAAMLAAAPAHANIIPRCGVTGQATAPATITYDPFSATGLSEVTIPLVLTRTRSFPLGRTNQISFVLTKPVGSPDYDVTYQGNRVLYSEGAVSGRPRALTSRDGGAGQAGEIRYDFGGLLASDQSLPLNLKVTVPPSADLSSGEPIEFDILYICSGEGGMADVQTATRLADGIRINVNVVSALQAYYAGSALDFGEIGDVTTAQVLAAPDAYSTPSTNTIRVKSSGPYEVEVRSQNNFKLTFPGGNLADTSQTIRYKAYFIGKDVTSNSSFGTKICSRAGVSGAAGTLPIRAFLLEGGTGKAASPNYADTITVTFSPVVAVASAYPCSLF